MNYISIEGVKEGKPIQIKVSNIILGASDYLRVDNMDYAKKIIEEYRLQGGNCFDTAHHYRHSDIAIGEYFAEFKNRDQFVIFAKGCHPVREYPHIPRVNREAIIADVEASLKKLKVDYVDLFALHRDDINVPVSEVIDTLNELIDEGKIHAIGVSNWSTERIKEANEYARTNNKVKFTFNSPNLSLAKPRVPRWPDCVSADAEMVQMHKEEQMPMISWSAQASGFFGGLYEPSKLENEEMVDVFYTEENWERFRRLKKLAQKYNTEEITLSLAWVLKQEFPIAAVIGPETIEQLNGSLHALTININQDECDELDLKRNSNIDHKIALQLYSVRKELEKDMVATLKKVADYGFKYVQMDGLRGNDLWEFRDELEKNDLKVIGLHIKHERFFNDLEGIVREASVFNCNRVFDKYIEEEDQNKVGYKNTKKQLLEVSRILSNFGITVGLHNPEYDFNNKVDGQKCLDYICTPEAGILIYPELDTYWINVADDSTIEYLNKYRERAELIHLKDILKGVDKNDLDNNLCACGKGEIDFSEIIELGENVGVKYYVIEQDKDSNQDIMISIKESLDYIKKLGREVLVDNE